MALEKMKIKNLDTDEEFEVLFNPTEYSIEDTSKWQDQERNRQKPELQYTGGDRKKLSMELFFDTYELGEDVRKHTGQIARLLIPSVDTSNGKRPPKVELSWGPADPDPASGFFPFVGVLESLKQQFTMFTGEGKPVRARLTVSFKEYSLPEEELQRNPQRSSYPVQTYTVKAGDTLSGIAGKLWKAPAKWRLIADANEIENPRALEPDQVLIIPAID
ncbi:MAG: peptidoglycan-binding protein [Anaerolineae bacterium]